MSDLYDKSKWAIVALAATLAAMSVLPSAALAGPATDEYTLQGADAEGKGETGEAPPTPRPNELPANVREQITDTAEDRALVTVATARELGAPDKPPSDDPVASTPDTSVPSAAISALGTRGSLALLAALALIALTAVVLRRRRLSEPPDS